MPTGRAFLKHELDEAVGIQPRNATNTRRADAAPALRKLPKPSAAELARLLADVAARDPAT
jgi:hypothetical protein